MKINLKNCHNIVNGGFLPNTLFWDIEFQDANLNLLIPEIIKHDIWKTNPAIGGRFQHNGDSDVLLNFCNESMHLKSELLEYVYNYDREIFKERWWRDLEYYQNNTSMSTFIFKDPPGFIMNPHLDNGHIILQMLINLVDNPNGTDFYDPKTHNKIYTSSGKQGDGVIFFNNASAPHGFQNGDKDRFIWYANIELR
jgi:hypothetical protein